MNNFGFFFSSQINECESLLISLKDANKDSLCLLEQKKLELNMIQSQIQSLKYEQSITNSKVGERLIAMIKSY